MASVAAGLVTASALWRLPYIQHLEVPEGAEDEPEPVNPFTATMPAPTHRGPLGRRRRGAEG